MDSDGTESAGASTAPLTLLVEYEGASAFLEDFRDRIALGSTFVRTDSDLPPDTEVFLLLTFPGLLRPIHLAGKVQGSSRARPEAERGLDIEFLGFDDIAKRRLQSLADAIIEENPRVVGRVVRVLIVEDNPHVAGLIRDGLTQRGPRSFGQPVSFQFHGADDGQEALQLMSTTNVDLILVELDLAVISGTEVIAELLADSRYRDCKVIAMSSRETGIFEARAAGCTNFLAKPLRLRELVSAVKSALASG